MRESWINASLEDVRDYLLAHRPAGVAPELVVLAYATTFVAHGGHDTNHKCILFFRPAAMCGVPTATVLACAVVPTTDDGEFQVLWGGEPAAT